MFISVDGPEKKKIKMFLCQSFSTLVNYSDHLIKARDDVANFCIHTPSFSLSNENQIQGRRVPELEPNQPELTLLRNTLVLCSLIA